ncbi:MAG: DinB family protein [Chloroflexi bacterium]|nr:DinB family protein [Chloroflexota bacterium]
MDLREYVAQALERTRQRTLDMVQDLRQEDLAWRPGPEANPVGFLLFHVFRSEDRYFHVWLSPAGEVWSREGWDRRWPMPQPPPDAPDQWTTGFSWTPQHVGAWAPPPREELLDYGQRVRKSALLVLGRLDLGLLPVPVRPDQPLRTRAYFLYQASHHEAQHQGQIDYISGLRKAGAAPSRGGRSSASRARKRA